MKIRLITAVLACLAGMVPTGASFADRTPAQQSLYQQATKDCNGPHYPCGARPYINYSGGWWGCVEPRSCR